MSMRKVSTEAHRSQAQNNEKRGSRNTLTKGTANDIIFCGFKGRTDIFSQRGVPQ